MTSFVRDDFPLEHPGVVRMERAFAWFAALFGSHPLRRLLDAWARRDAARRLQRRRAQARR